MPRIAATFAAAAATSALAGLALAPAVGAALPSNRDRTIVPGRSIGGVGVGVSGRKAVATWGPSQCAAVRVILCRYEFRNSSANFNTGNVAFQLNGGKVTGLLLTAAYDFGSAGALIVTVPRALARYKTDSGIGLGATIAQLRRAYPAVRGRSSSSGQGATYMLGSGARATHFTFAPGGGTLKLYMIRIGSIGG